MGLFGPKPTLDEEFSRILLNEDGYTQRSVAKNQENIRRSLEPGERMVTLAVEDYPPGSAVVVTNQRVLIMRSAGREVQEGIPVSQLHAVQCDQVDRALWVVGLHGPGRAFRFNQPGTAYALAEAVEGLLTQRPRTVPTLYPSFFKELLTETGKPPTEINMMRLLERVFVMVKTQAASYFQQVGDSQAAAEFERRFAEGGPPERILHVVDDMVDWLWAWNPACHETLEGLFPKIKRLLLQPHSFLRSPDDEIPPWSQWVQQ